MTAVANNYSVNLIFKVWFYAIMIQKLRDNVINYIYVYCTFFVFGYIYRRTI